MANNDLLSVELRELIYRYNLATMQRRRLITELRERMASFRQVRADHPQHEPPSAVDQLDDLPLPVSG